MNDKSEIKGIVGRLATEPRFAECSLSDLAALAKQSTAASVPAQWPLIHEDTPADACYVILDGTVEVVVDHRQVASLGAGAVVGEIGLARHRLRNATVVSTTPLTVLHIPAEAFTILIDTLPAIRAALLNRVAA